jgi:RHH-type transcriptional regulator, rel operon repressor / antitoxin RelB
MNTTISVCIPKELTDHLDGIAKETKSSRSFIVQKALESYIENYADLQIALDRLRDNTDPFVASKAINKSLGLYV